MDRLEGQWLQQLAVVDGRGAAGADQGQEVGSTAAWLRARLRLGAGAAASFVRTARAVFRGPLTVTADALLGGELSVAHARVLAHGPQDLPEQVTVEAEAVLVAAACRLDPPRLRRVLGHLCLVADPEAADRHTELRHQRRGLWLAPTWDGMVAVDGLLEPEAGQSLVAALEPLARPADAQDPPSGSQRRADALAELARRALAGGRLPHTGGVRPQLTVTVDLDSLLGRHHAVGGEVGGVGPLDPEACRRLACDGALTRVLVTRSPHGHRHPDHDHDRNDGSHGGERLAERLRASMALLPPALGVPRPSRWRSAGPAGSCTPPNAPPWLSATVAVRSPAANGPGLVRGPSPAPLAARRPDRSGQSGLAVPGPSSRGP